MFPVRPPSSSGTLARILIRSFSQKGKENFYKGSGQDYILTHNFIKQHSHRKLYGKFEFIQLEGADKDGLRHNHVLDEFQHPLSQSIRVMTL